MEGGCWSNEKLKRTKKHFFQNLGGFKRCFKLFDPCCSKIFLFLTFGQFLFFRLVVPVVSDVSVFRMFRFRSRFRFRFRFFLQEPNLRDVVPPVAKSQPPLDVIDLENKSTVAIKGQHSRRLSRNREKRKIHFSLTYRPIPL